MSVNVGAVDRTIRTLLGVVLLLLPFVSDLALWTNPVARFGIPAVGVILLITAAFRFCPLYRLVGLRTCRI